MLPSQWLGKRNLLTRWKAGILYMVWCWQLRLPADRDYLVPSDRSIQPMSASVLVRRPRWQRWISR